MDDDFRVGDVAVCVDDSPYKAPVHVAGRPWLMKVGSVWRVTACGADMQGNPTIALAGIQSVSRFGFQTVRFRKLPKADEQFTEQMRKLKPHRNRVPA